MSQRKEKKARKWEEALWREVAKITEEDWQEMDRKHEAWEKEQKEKVEV